jgi:cytochrome P450
MKGRRLVKIPVPNNDVSLQALRALLRQKNVFAALEVFHAALGDVFQIPLPGFNPVMLVGPEANRFILVEQRDNLHWRAEQDPVTRLLRHGVLVEDGDSHDSLRHEINPALHRRVLEQYVEAMWRCTDTVINNWPSAAGSVDMLPEMRKIALLILMKTLFGVDFGPDLKRLWQAILRTLRYISPGPWIVWRNVPSPGYQRALQQLDDYLHQLITLRRASDILTEDLLSLLIGSGMPDQLIRDQLLTILIAGHDTSTALLTWALYLLSCYPEVRTSVQNEVTSVLGRKPANLSDLSRLEYLDQVLKETLRLYPPIHLGSRIAAMDLEFRSFPIPAGTRVLYSIYLTHRDEKHWHNAAAFMPERFSPELARQRHPYTFLPFGGGPRNCIGMAFAQVEVKVVLARILQKFDLEFTGHAVRLHMGATLEPRPGVRIRTRSCY